MKVRFETTPDGDMAIMERAEYERLVALAAEAEENAGTARLVAQARKDIAEGAPLLPLEVADALANGENPIRVLREFRDFTQMELAARIGITKVTCRISKTGSGKARSNCIRRQHGRSACPSICSRPSSFRKKRPIRRALRNVGKSSLRCGDNAGSAELVLL